MTDTLTLTITDLGAQGDGIAHHNGSTIFVPGALPGEKIQVKLFESHDGQQRAEILSIQSSHAHRVSPPCPHFLKCGGCRLQHLNSQAVADWKKNILKKMMSKEGIADVPFLPSLTTEPASRRRARVAAVHKSGQIHLGFNAWRSHDLVDLTICAVLLPELTDFIHKLRGKLSLWLQEGESCDIQITFLAGGFDVVFIGGPLLELEQRQNLAILAEELDIAQVSWRKWDRSPIEPVAFRKPVFVSYGETTVRFPPASFLQATQTGEHALIAFAKNAVQDHKKVMDLFCGLGGFGLSQEQPQQVHFSDADGLAIEALGEVAKHNPRFHIDRRNLISDPYSSDDLNVFDAVIFDPPRGGSKALASEIAHSCVPTVVAISCDPMTFVRDARILIEGGYSLKSVQPVDQFLWSTHLELAAWFEKR